MIKATSKNRLSKIDSFAANLLEFLQRCCRKANPANPTKGFNHLLLNDHIKLVFNIQNYVYVLTVNVKLFYHVQDFDIKW